MPTLTNPPYPLLPSLLIDLAQPPARQYIPRGMGGVLHLLAEMVGPDGSDLAVIRWLVDHGHYGYRDNELSCPIALAIESVPGVEWAQVSHQRALFGVAGHTVDMELPAPVRQFVRLFDLGRWKALDLEWHATAVAHWCKAGMHEICGGILRADFGGTVCHCMCHCGSRS
jgi:hypothetical protein